MITGASTGIGKACALRLAGLGHRVFAGVRRASDGRVLVAEGGEAITPVLIDVADEGSIAAAVAEVEGSLGDAKLVGLVNNAGIAVGGPQEYLPLSEWKRQFDVNVFGLVETTRAFFDLLLAAQGRVVNISSVGGKVPSPFMAPYSASKFAVEAITDGLRLEVRPLGMFASCVEPGAVKTEIWKKGEGWIDHLESTMPAKLNDRYAKPLVGVRKFTTDAAARGVPAECVAMAVEHALFSRRPRARYAVGPDARILIALRWLLPDSIFDKLMSRAV